MVMVSLKKHELEAFKALVYQNRDSRRLQNITNMSYLESISLIKKLNRVR
jgi:hypothetical protein